MANKESQESLFRRLTKLFRSGPVVKRKLRTTDTVIAVPDRTTSSGALLFQKSLSPTYSTITSNAYNLSERLMRYQDFCEMEYCLHGDTKIAIPGGYKTIQELSRECEGKPEHTFVVYSYDHNEQRIVPALGKQARQTRVDHAYTVTFDNGQKIIGTPNHRLMKRDGTFCKIEDLQPGDAMMPFYRRDLFNGCKEEGEGYRWIYTMDRRSKMNGWVTEHRVIGEMLKGSSLNEDEVVHHRNFIKFDNRPENLQVMTDGDHKKLHAEILNGAKWSDKNADWIEQFKINHSKFMTENNPAERRDITFGRILEIAERTSFNSRKMCEILDTDPNVIKRRLRRHGYKDFETFAKAYNPDWQNAGWNNEGKNNPRYNQSITFDKICSKFSKGMSKQELASSLDTSIHVIANRLQERGYRNFTEFSTTYDNLKVESIEYHGVIPLFDLTVDGYKNFATDTVISHNTPELAAALDIYSDETCAQDDKGKVLHVYSNNPKIKQLLEDLFYNTLNVEFNLRSWVRNLVKFGDFFLYNDVSPEYGVINAFPIPVNEIEREENYDRNDPSAVRFRWVTLGNKVLENWEISHFRLLGNDMFLPYGSSVIEPARRIWRQLILIEDAMLVYRVVRAPERRVFYIDVGGMPAEAVSNYVEEQKRALKSSQVIDRQTGRVDLRYNPMSVDEDFFLPVRGGESGTKIETLAGGQNTAAVEDVQYIQKKLFAALKIPKAYLGYDEMLASKATLAQEDIRFSRTINVIQKTIVSELNKLAMIHLYANGYNSDDLQDFTLRLSNPSTVAQQQKLELWRSRFEIAASGLGEGLTSKQFVRKEILGLNDEDIRNLDAQRYEEKIVEGQIEAAQPDSLEGDSGSTGDTGDEEELGLGGEELAEPSGEEAEEPGAEEAEAEPENAGEDEETQLDLLTATDDLEFDDKLAQFSARDRSLKTPVKVNKQLQKYQYNRSRRRTHGASKTHMPDLKKMTSNFKSIEDPHDNEWMRSVISNPLGESPDNTVRPPSLSYDMINTLKKMDVRLGRKQAVQGGILSEDFDLTLTDNNDEET